ncbi:hypothetical protein NG54_07945 [Heyndrickxia ginsengihumi]|uniref:Phage tail tape measure protein domain-containing protein n=2 Tax=Heyndrickxia ginsengihumi TaxID=363870 RepID=A0A0A6VGD4_9BACI|nr:hypothetical protein NG54_07945 [Heyndrickxia ginsengihumi]
MQIAEQQLANRITLTTQSLEKAKQAETESVSESDKNRQALQQLQNEQNNLRSSSERLASEYKLQKTQMGDSASEADKLAAAESHLRQQVDLTKQVIANLEKQLSLTEQEYGKNSTEANQMAAKLNAAKASVANLDHELEQIKENSSNAAEGMEELSKKVTAGNFLRAAEVLSGVSDKVIDLGKSAIETGMEMADSQQDIQNNLGLTSKEAEKLQGVAKNVFEHGVTDSVESASKAVQSVKMNMGDLNNSDLEKVTNKIIGIGKHTDTDVNENVRAASQLMNHFGVSADDSLDLIAAGFQDGLNKSDDFLDTLNEYSPQFAQAGFSAKDMLNIIDKGMKSGAFNTDKAADAVKEFGIRLRDGTIEKNIGNYSKTTQELFEKFQDGKATAAQVFQSINKDISNTDDKTKKYALGNAAMGTQYEDLGDKAVDAFAKTGKAIDDVTGKADQMAKRSPGEKWQQTLRQLKDALAPIGQDLVNTLTPVVQMIGSMAKWFSNLPTPVRVVIEVLGALVTVFVALSPLIAAISIALPIIGTILSTLGAIMGGFLALLSGPVLAVIAAVITVITAVILVIKNWGSIIDWLKGIWSGFSSWIANLWQGILTVASNIWGSISAFFSNLWNSISSVASTAWTGFTTWITGIWQGIVSIASTIWHGLVDVFTFIFYW